MGQLVSIDSNNNVRIQEVGPMGPPGPSSASNAVTACTVFMAFDWADVESGLAALTEPSPTQIGTVLCFPTYSTFPEMTGVYVGQTPTDAASEDDWLPLLRVSDPPESLVAAYSYYTSAAEIGGATNPGPVLFAKASVPGAVWDLFANLSGI